MGFACRPVVGAAPGALRAGAWDHPLEPLLAGHVACTNTMAAWGNAGLVAIG